MAYPKHGRQGSASLPDGQARRGTPDSDSRNSKTHAKPDSLGVKTPLDGQVKRGYPVAGGGNMSKQGGSLTSADGALSGYPSYAEPAAPSTTNTGSNRQRFGLGTPDELTGSY